MRRFSREPFVHHIHTHPIFRSRVFYIFFCFSPPASFFPASVENGLKRDGEKRDAIKMKLVPKRRPKAKFYVRQPCRMCIYSLTGLFSFSPESGIDVGNIWHYIHECKHSPPKNIQIGFDTVTNFLWSFGIFLGFAVVITIGERSYFYRGIIMIGEGMVKKFRRLFIDVGSAFEFWQKKILRG